MYKSMRSIYYAKLSKNFSYYISPLLIVVKCFPARFCKNNYTVVYRKMQQSRVLCMLRIGYKVKGL